LTSRWQHNRNVSRNRTLTCLRPATLWVALRWHIFPSISRGSVGNVKNKSVKKTVVFFTPSNGRQPRIAEGHLVTVRQWPAGELKSLSVEKLMRLFHFGQGEFGYRSAYSWFGSTRKLAQQHAADRHQRRIFHVGRALVISDLDARCVTQIA